jgi:hypothetical protein
MMLPRQDTTACLIHDRDNGLEGRCITLLPAACSVRKNTFLMRDGVIESLSCRVCARWPRLSPDVAECDCRKK